MASDAILEIVSNQAQGFFLNRKMTLTLLLFLILVSAVIFFSFYPAICFLMRFREGKTPPFCTNHVTRTEVQVSKIGAVVHIFRPNPETSATLILVPGLHPFGIYDSRFQFFATSCANSGFTVVALDVQEFRRFQVTPNAVNLISNLVNALPELIPVGSLQNIGMLGISYGSGPVLVAASRKEVRDKVNFAVSIGGYYNLIHAMEYSVGGRHQADGGSQPPPPHQWGRMIFALNHLESLAPPSDAPLLREALELRLNLKENEAKEVEGKLSSEGKEFLNEVLNGLTLKESEKFKKTLQMHMEVSKELSPEFALKDFSPKLRLYLLHGPGDNLIPSFETEELTEALHKIDHPYVISLITPFLNHVDPAQKVSLIDKMKLLIWCRAFLREASRKN
jgi:hypothetical protein